MEIVIVAGIDPFASRASGTCSYISNLINSLSKKNIKVTVIGISKNREDKGIEYISIANAERISSYRFLITLLLKAPFLKIPSTAIIHTQRPDDMIPFIIFNRKNPKVCTLHGQVSRKIHLKKREIVGKIYDLMERTALKHIDRLIAVDKSTMEYYVQKYPWLNGKIEVIPVGIDRDTFKPRDKQIMREKYGFNSSDKIVLYVGRLEKEKNLDFLFRAFKRICDGNEKCKLVLVGEGSEKKDLNKLASDLKLNDVIFMGQIEQERIPEIMSCADIFVLTSQFESGPLVVLEALACGLPVVSVDVGRVREFISNGDTGTICERDEAEFAAAIQATLNGSKNRKDLDLLHKFTFEETAKKTIRIYKELNGDII
jgi:glycosyltransferase involved in cell wall biosynthesis